MLLTHRLEPPLDACIETLWYYDGSRARHQRERVLPNGRFQIVIDLASGRGAISGMRSRYVELDAGAIVSVMGVVFRPGGARAFFDSPACDFYNQIVPLDAAWGMDAIRLRDRLCDVGTAAERFKILEGALRDAMEGAARRIWTIATRIEETSEDHRQQRWSAAVRDVS